jgi:hypothetical protein
MAACTACLFASNIALGADYVNAFWCTNAMGSWTDAANWTAFPGEPPLPDPGYPGTNGRAMLRLGTSVITGDVEVACLYAFGATVSIDNDATLTCSKSLNGELPETEEAGRMVIGMGNVNILSPNTGATYNVTAHVGTNGNGYLDFGATWGTTNGFPADFGTLANVSVYLQQGGLRVDAESITMQNSCLISNAAQEVTFRGDWLNPDATTIFIVQGRGGSGTTVDGNFSFGGCTLSIILDTNGVHLLNIGRNAFMTNVILKIGSTDALQSTSNTYDLVRVPTAKTIYTNGMSLSSDVAGGIECTTSIDDNRGGYDYLVISPVNFTPSTTITNPAAGAVFSSGATITVNATASDKNGTVSKVEFYSGSTKLGEDTIAPYSYSWTNVLGGRYELKTVATDNDGATGSSSVVVVGVQGMNAQGKNVFIAGDVVITYDPGCVQE